MTEKRYCPTCDKETEMVVTGEYEYDVWLEGGQMGKSSDEFFQCRECEETFTGLELMSY